MVVIDQLVVTAISLQLAKQGASSGYSAVAAAVVLVMVSLVPRLLLLVRLIYLDYFPFLIIIDNYFHLFLNPFL